VSELKYSRLTERETAGIMRESNNKMTQTGGKRWTEVLDYKDSKRANMTLTE
jgi:hypothetical protein